MKKILFVDDDPNVLAALQRQLRKHFTVETACGAEEGLRVLERAGEFGVVVADMKMPGMDGATFLAAVKKRAPDLVRVMLTGNADLETAVRAVNEGSIFSFLNKPCLPEQLTQTLEAALRQHYLIVAERELLEKTLRGAVKVLSEILAMVDPQCFGRSQTLRENVRRLAEHLGLDNVWELEVAAMLCQIGHVTIPPDVALKARVGHPLSEPEAAMMTRIPEVGRNLLANIPRLEGVAQIVYYQAKHFDGSGFPADPTAGEAIPLGARLLKVLLDLAQLEAKGQPRDQALDHLRQRRGWYDPRLLDAVAARLATAAEAINPAVAETRLPVTLDELRAGYVLADNVLTHHGTLVVAAGHPVTVAVLERLRNFALTVGVTEPIYVQPPASP
jgi:response regulator RpfG family c-di-GMP phosphodiesterase